MILRPPTADNLTIAGAARQRTRFKSVPLYLVPFLVAFACAFCANHVLTADRFLVFDSAHYYQSTELVLQALRGDHSHLQELAANLSLDGPVLPVAGALFMLASPAASHLQPLLFLQCFLHALSASLVFLLSKRLTFIDTVQTELRGRQLYGPNKDIAPAEGTQSWKDVFNDRLSFSGRQAPPLILALLFSINPAGILACGRYLTETVTTVLLLALVYGLSSFHRQQESSCTNEDEQALKVRLRKLLLLPFCGVCAALVVLAKSALLPAAAVIIMGTIGWRANFRSMCTRGSMLACGGATVLAPWVLFTAIATGQPQLLPNRLPGWNIALGSDIETDGWSAIPVPPLLELNYFDKPLNIIYGIYNQHPIEYLALTARKVVRLAGAPWNDFATSFFPGFTGGMLVVHQFVLLSAVAGALTVMAMLAARSAGKPLLRFSRPAGRSCIASEAAPEPAPREPNISQQQGTDDDNCGIAARSSSVIESENNELTLQSQLQIGCICAAVMACHLVFVPFEAIARYAYSATPFALLLAYMFFIKSPRASLTLWLPFTMGAVALFQLDLLPVLTGFTSYGQAGVLECVLRAAAVISFLVITAMLIATRVRQAEAGKLLVFVCALAAVFVSMFACAFALKRDTGQWQCTLSGGLQAEREILVNAQLRGITKELDWAAVLIDGDSNLEQARVSVNGKALNSRCHSIYEIPNSYRYQQTLIHTMKCQAAAEGAVSAAAPISRLRQWRVFKIPVNVLNCGTNKVEISANPGSTVTIYGDYINTIDNRLRIPSLQSFALCKVQSTNTRDGRPIDIIGYPRSIGVSRLKSVLKGNSTRAPLVELPMHREASSVPENHHTLATTGGDDHNADLSPVAGSQTGHYRIYVLAAYCKQTTPGTDCNLEGMTFGNRFISVY